MKKMLTALLVGACLPVSFALAQPATTPAPTTPLPVAVFGQHPTMSDPEISDDGKVAAARIRFNGEKVLAIFSLENLQAPPEIIARDGEFGSYGDRRVLSWNWIDGDNLLIRLAQYTDLDGDKFDILRTINYNRKTKKITTLGWDGSFLSTRTLWVSRTGPPRVLIERLVEGQGTERIGNPEVIEVDVATGRQNIVQHRNPIIRGWYADGNGVVRMGFGGDSDKGKRLVIYRPGPGRNFDTIVDEKMEKYGTGTPVPSIFLANGTHALATSRKTGFTELYEVDLRTMELGRKIYSVPGHDIEGIFSNQDDNALEALYYIGDRPNMVYFDPRLKEIKAGLDEVFGAGNAWITSTDDARENIIVAVGATDQVGAYFLYSTVTGSMQNLGWSNPTLKDMKLNPVRSIRYQASDGKSIHAVLTLPRLRQHRNLPLIVLPHGGPWGQDYERFDIWSQSLAEYGYAVVQPNFRGSTGTGREWESAADGNWGTRMQDDLLDAITHLAREGIADPMRVCIMGWSYGGYAASRGAQRDGKHYRCAISGAGVHDIPDMVSYDKDYLGRYGSKYIGAAAANLVTVSPARHPEDFSIPILIVHGRKDDRVPVSQSRDLVAALRRAGKVEGRDFVYLEQPRNTHHFPHEADMIQFLEEVRKFLDKHNPA